MLRRFLKDAGDLPTVADRGPDPRRALGGEIAHLHAFAVMNRHGIFVLRVLGFGSKLDWIAGSTQVDRKAAGRRALGGIGVLGADDQER